MQARSARRAGGGKSKPPAAAPRSRRKGHVQNGPFPNGPRHIPGSRIDGVQVADLSTVVSYLRIPRRLFQSTRFVAGITEEVRFGAAAKAIDLLRLERRPRDCGGELLADLRRLFRHCDEAQHRGDRAGA